jgi:hypothetical protein
MTVAALASRPSTAAGAFRDNAGPNEHALVDGFNQRAFAIFGHLLRRVTR